MNHRFLVCSLSREDLSSRGYETSNLTDKHVELGIKIK